MNFTGCQSNIVLFTKYYFLRTNASMVLHQLIFKNLSNGISLHALFVHLPNLVLLAPLLQLSMVIVLSLYLLLNSGILCPFISRTQNHKLNLKLYLRLTCSPLHSNNVFCLSVLVFVLCFICNSA